MRRLVAPARARVRLRQLPLLRNLHLAAQRGGGLGGAERGRVGRRWGRAGLGPGVGLRVGGDRAGLEITARARVGLGLGSVGLGLELGLRLGLELGLGAGAGVGAGAAAAGCTLRFSRKVSDATRKM